MATLRRPPSCSVRRDWPAPPSGATARPPRAPWPWPLRVRPRRWSSCAARRTSWPRPRSSSRSPTSWPPWWPPRVRTPPASSTTPSTACVRRSRRTFRSGGFAAWSAGPGQILDTYLHLQAGRGVNAVAVVIEGGTDELAHDIAVHIAFTKPTYLEPRRGPRGRRRRRAGDVDHDLAQRGEARGRTGQDH